MYTLCSACKTPQQVNAEQLQESAQITCQHCSEKFNALEFLSVRPISNTDQQPTSSPLFEPLTKPKPKTAYWLVASIACLAVLFGQIYYFKSRQITHHPKIRPWLIQFSQAFNYALPPYQNVEEISVLSNQLERLDHFHHEFSTIIVNQADYPQPYPHFQFSVFDYNGDLIAKRTFTPKQYQAPKDLLATGESAKIKLALAQLPAKMGGYSIQLTQ